MVCISAGAEDTCVQAAPAPSDIGAGIGVCIDAGIEDVVYIGADMDEVAVVAVASSVIELLITPLSCRRCWTTYAWTFAKVSAPPSSGVNTKDSLRCLERGVLPCSCRCYSCSYLHYLMSQ